MKAIPFALLAILFLGCAVKAPPQFEDVSSGIAERTGTRPAPLSAPDRFEVPEGVSLADGLTEDETVAMAMWNNAAYRADLAELGIGGADVVEAGLLRNPILSLLFPWGPKQLEFTLSWPIEAFWQRPRRVEWARIRLERIGESLVENGLALARDARFRWAELKLARDRAALAFESAALRSDISTLVRARFQAGDVSEPGHEIEHPMAVVILGGLVTSTALNLFIMPALYLRWGKAIAR